MSSLYDQLLANIGKTASADNIKKGLQDFSNEDLIILAEELAVMGKDADLANMAKILPVYGDNQKTDAQIETEQIIQNVPTVVGEVADETKNEMTMLASKENRHTEKLAEDSEEDKEEDKKEEKEEDKEDKEEEKKDEEKEEEKKSQEEASGMEVTATEQLMAILKEGAALEELIELRAAAMVEDLLKQAEDYEIARAVVDQAADQLTDNPMKAHEYSEQMMDKARTVAAAKDIPMSEAAQAVAETVVETAKTAGLIDVSMSKNAFSYLSELDKYAAELEAAYEKIAEEIGDAAEAMLVENGMKMGLQDPQLHEYVRRGMEEIRTLAAKRDINLAQAAQAYLAGDTGSVSGIVEPTSPAPSQAPSPAKTPINSNQTQSPDEHIVEMVAPADPSVMAAAETKEAADKEDFKAILKEALTSALADLLK